MKKAKTKANARNAQEMLAAQATSAGGFGSSFGAGFAGVFTAFAQPAPTADSAEASGEENAWATLMASRSRDQQEVSDPALILAFKQLSKRDPVTRLKALESIAALFAGMDAATATAVLQPWLQVYEKIQLDNDRRMREHLYKTFAVLLARVPGKSLQSHLRAIFPLWWLHQQDPSAEVARESTNLFTATFPTASKRAQVLVYCHREYFSYCASLFTHTPQTLSDQTLYSLEESVEKWERIIACALMSVAEFINTTAAAEAAPAAAAASAASAAPSVASITAAAYSTLLTPALWKLASCRTVHIRRAFYALLKSLVVHNPAGVVESNLPTLSSLILTTLLDEADRTNQQSMLDTVLTFLRKFGTFAWDQLSKSAGSGPNLVQSAFYPRLQKMLLTGLGNWNIVYPTLLPLLSLLPDSVMMLAPAAAPSAASSSPPPPGLANFYSFFFGSLWDGRRVLRDAATGAGSNVFLTGSREFHALLDCYNECLLFAIKKRKADAALVRHLVHTHLLASPLAPALHFASASASDPSLTKEAYALNKFGTSFFERAGRTIALTQAILQPAETEAMWGEISGTFSAALQAAGSAASEVTEAAVAPAELAVGSVLPSPPRRANAAAAAVPSVDAYAAVGIILAQVRPKAASDAGDEAAAGMQPAHTPLLRCVAAVFQLSLAHFTERPAADRLSSLKLSSLLAESYSLSSILAATDPPSSLSSFVSSSLLPVLRQLLSAAGQATDNASDVATAAQFNLYISTVELFCRGLLGRALEELGLDKPAAVPDAASSSSSSSSSSAAPTRLWEELLQLLSASASLSRSASILSAKCHLSLLRILFTLFARCRSVYGHASLQDLVVDQAERFLTCEKPELFPEYLGIFRCIISAPGLLANDVLSTLLSSFLDGVSSFQKQEGSFAMLACTPAQSSTSPQFVQSFEKDTGCSIQALPSLVELLGTLLGPDSPLEQVSASADEAASMRSQIVRALFWLQFSARQRVAAAAAAVWRSMDRAALKEHSRILLDLAASFRQCLLSSPLSLFTSHFIVSWSAWLVQLYATVSHPFLQQKILDSALPTHAEIKQLMAGDAVQATSLHDVAERLRVIRDLLSELLSSTHAEVLSERVLFLGEASPSQVGAVAPAASNSSSLQWEGTPRLTLLLDLLALHSFLRCFEREADPADMPPNDRASLALDAEQAQAHADEDHSHQSIRSRLQRYVVSGFLSSSQVLTILKSALAESKSTVKDTTAASPEVVVQATNSSRAYTSAFTWLLRFVRDAYLAADSPSSENAAEVQKLLVSFLASVPQTALRTQDHTALFPPLEATLVAVLESGCLGASTAAAPVIQLSKWVLVGLEAGMRLLSKQNSKLFALASSLRLSAALLRAMSAISRAGAANEDLQSTLASTRTKLLALAANLNLFDALPTGAAGFSLDAARFLAARSSLLLSMVELPAAVAGDDAPLDAELPPALLQSMVLWSGSVVRFATNQHTAAIAQAKRPSASAVAASSSCSSSSAAVVPAVADVSAAWNLQYLSSTFALMAYLTPRLLSSVAPTPLSSNAPLSSALHLFIGTCFSLLVGRGPSCLLRVVSVKSFTRWSVNLELILRSYREARTGKMLEIVRECARLQLRADGEVDADSPDLRALFVLLSHSFPCIALCSLHFLSIGLLERAIATPISFEIDEAAELRHVLEASAKHAAKSNKKRQQALENGQTPESEDLELEHYRKTLRSSYRSAMTQKRQDLLMPRTLQRILEDRVQINEIDVIEEEQDDAQDDEELFFSFRPVAQQLRGHLLTWSLVLDLLSQSLPVPAAADAPSSSSSSSTAAASVSLSSERSALLVSFLRDGDCMGPFMGELVEHILVCMTDAQVEQLILGTVARYEHRVAGDGGSAILQPAVEEAQPAPAVVVEDEDEEGNVKPVATAPSSSPSASPAPAVDSPAIREYPLWFAPCMLLPSEARADVTVRPFIMKRLLRIRKLEQGESGSDSSSLSSDQCIFFGSASALLYLRTLRVLPALSRSWFSHIDRSNGAVISKLTSSSFSALLIQDELLNVQQRQAAMAKPADDDDEPEFAITTNYEPTIWRLSGRTATPPAVVGARFTRGEIVMGLSLKLPACYPLLPVNVSLAESVKLKSESSRKWCLSISSILASSDGRLFDAIQVWRSNLESHFSGVEECSICMAIVSATNHALPRMKCHECKNKFHSQCLYKWFQTSGNSKCKEKHRLSTHTQRQTGMRGTLSSPDRSLIRFVSPLLRGGPLCRALFSA